MKIFPAIWRQFSNQPDWPIIVRYELLPKKPKQGFLKAWKYRLERLMRIMGLDKAHYQNKIWLSGLKHGSQIKASTTLVVLGDLESKKESRLACQNLREILCKQDNYCPVLITSLEDFTFYAKLGWLVEYLPRMNSSENYQNEKLKYLVWRYRQAHVLALSDGLLKKSNIEKIFETS